MRRSAFWRQKAVYTAWQRLSGLQTQLRYSTTLKYELLLTQARARKKAISSYNA